MLLTWVGLKCTVRRRVDTSYTIRLQVVDGTNPYQNTHDTVFTYIKVPPQISRYEPSHVHHIVVYDGIDTGQNVHVRLHRGYNVELTLSFASWQDSYLADTKVVLKVQHPSRVGGAYDHPAGIDSHLIAPLIRKKLNQLKLTRSMFYRAMMLCTIKRFSFMYCRSI